MLVLLIDGDHEFFIASGVNSESQVGESAFLEEQLPGDPHEPIVELLPAVVSSI